MKNILKILAGIILLAAIFPFIQFMAECLVKEKFDAAQFFIILGGVAGTFLLFFSGVFMLRKVKF